MNADEVLIKLRACLQQMDDGRTPMAREAKALIADYDSERDQKVLILVSDRPQETRIIMGGADVSHLIHRLRLDLNTRKNPLLQIELTKKPQIEISDEAAAKILMYYSENGGPENVDD